MRYTDEQRNLAEGMEILIKLYYRLKETDKKEWLSDSIARLTAEIVYKVIPGFTTCLYLKSSDNRNRLKYFTGAPMLRLMKMDYQRFLDAMDAFSVKPGIEAISILGINYGFTKFGEQCKSVDKKKWILPPIEYRDSKHLSMVSRDFAEYRPGLEDYPGLGDYPPYHEKIQYQTNQKSVFAETLYRSRVKEGAISDTLYRTSFYMNSASPYYSWGNSTFLGLIRYYFAKYIVVFESFDRITQCEYEPCKKLIFDIRSGRRRFCSDLCRKRFHDALQDNDKRLCREKQNVWIRRKMTPEIISRYPLPRVPGTIYRDDCQRCNGPVAKGGLCPALPYYNKKLFAALEKDKDHPRARRIQGLEFDRSRRTPTR